MRAAGVEKGFRMRHLPLLAIISIITLLPPCVVTAAAPDSPVGVWRTIDDHTGREQGLVAISESGGVLTGRIVGVTDPKDRDQRCTRCSGPRRNQPVLGLAIITGLHRNGDRWTGGEILDPEDGSTYNCSLRVEDGGDKLLVRGFLGLDLLGRTQTWLRAP